MSKKIKVPGYTKKVNYNGEISYRPFSPLVKSKVDAIFSHGNFSITTNTDVNDVKDLPNNTYSDYVSLEDLDIPYVATSIVEEKSERAKLNLDWSDLKNHAYFGSLRERIRVSIENILNKYPSSIILHPFTVVNSEVFEAEVLYCINPDSNDKISYTFFNWSVFSTNPGNITFGTQLEGDVLPYKDLMKNPSLFEVVFENGDVFNILRLANSSDVELISTIDTSILDLGNIFVLGGSIREEHKTQKVVFRPNEKIRKEFFDKLDPLESQLISYDGKNTYKFKKRVFVEESGIFIETDVRGTWPMSDGFNLDINGATFDEYINTLIELSDEFDTDISNIIIRKLVTTSIIEFDTDYDIDDEDNIIKTAQKVKLLLSIYGRHFDIIKNYIDSLKFLNVVTYDKVNNTPDILLKEIANNIGWDVFNSEVISKVNGELTQLTDPNEEYEAFRRLILSTPYVWGAKGTRKAIEFITTFFGVDKSLVNFNEHVYLAKKPLDRKEYDKRLALLPDDVDISAENDVMDDEGYPRILPNTEDDYFQKGGKWYRDTSGVDGELVISANNPHEVTTNGNYFDKYSNILPKESNHTLEEFLIDEMELIINETFEKDGSESFSLIEKEDTVKDISIKRLDTIEPTLLIDDCGCETTETLNKELVISATFKGEVFNCNYNRADFVEGLGIINFYDSDNNLVEVSGACCKGLGGYMVYSYSLERNVCVNEYKEYTDCGRYQPTTVGGSELNADGFLYFTDRNNNTVITSLPHATCCPSDTTLKAYGNGYGCSKGYDVREKCLVIDSVGISKGKHDGNANDFTFLSPLTSSLVTKSISVDGNSVVDTDFVISNNTSLTITYNGVNKIIDFNDFINISGVIIRDLTQTYVLTITLPSPYDTNTYIFKFRFVECPNINYSAACVKLTKLLVIDPNQGANGLNFTFKSVSSTENKVIHIYTGEKFNYFNFEDYYQIITDLNQVISIRYTNDTTSVDKTYSLKNYIDISNWTENDNTVYSSEIKVNDEITFILYYEYVPCIGCHYLDPYMSTEIDGVQYLVFEQNPGADEGSPTTEVENPSCCPSYSRVVKYGDMYRCAYDMNTVIPECEVMDNTINETSIVGVTNVVSKNEVTIVGKLLVNDEVWTDDTTLTIPSDGNYYIEYKGYANHSIGGSSDLPYRRMVLTPYINGLIGNSGDMVFNFYEDDAPTTDLNFSRLYLGNLKSGDTIVFKQVITLYTGETYITTNLTSGVIRLKERIEVCGCDVEVTGVINKVWNEGKLGDSVFDFFTKRDSAYIEIINSDGTVNTINFGLYKLSTPHNLNLGVVNISDSTLIKFHNIIQPAEKYPFGVTENQVYSITGSDLKNNKYSTLRMVYNGDVAYIIDFTFAFDCLIPLVKDYTLTTSRNSTQINYDTSLNIGTPKIDTLNVVNESVIYGSVTANLTPKMYGDIIFDIINTGGVTMYEVYPDGSESVTPTSMFREADLTPTSCTGSSVGTLSLTKRFKLIVSPGTYDLRVLSNPGTSVCYGGAIQVLVCNLTEETSNLQTSTYTQIDLYSDSTYTKLIYHTERRYIGYCKYDTSSGYGNTLENNL